MGAVGGGRDRGGIGRGRMMRLGDVRLHRRDGEDVYCAMGIRVSEMTRLGKIVGGLRLSERTSKPGSYVGSSVWMVGWKDEWCRKRRL